MSENPTWFMRRALKLALKGAPFTHPNPLVGAVIVKDGEKIGEGWHKQFGGAHAEVEALNNCSESPKGATLYVTLEPCCHQGKTPPCTKAIIEAGISKVVISSLDPSEKVHGKGVEELQKAGIEVEHGMMQDDVRRMNLAFFTFHEKGRPLVTLKMVLSLDGKVGFEGEKFMMSSEPALKFAHQLRAEHDAILVGAGTVLNDDPSLTTRLVEGPDPLRVILKGDRDLPSTLLVFRGEEKQSLVIHKQDPKKVLEELAAHKIESVLVEGGPHTWASFIEAGCWDHAYIVVTPHWLGEKAIPAPKLPDGWDFKSTRPSTLGRDVLFHVLPN